jgi:DNA polymerase I
MSDSKGEQLDFSSFPAQEDAEEERPDEEAVVVAGGVEAAEVIDASDKRFPDAEGEVDVAVTQVDYSVEYADGEEYPVVHVFGRDGQKPLHVRVLGFEPYFYVPTSRLAERDQRPEEEFDAILDSRETDEDGEPFVSIRGEELTKLIGRTPRDVGQLRDEFEEHYEADILFPNRFLIDKDVGSGIRVPARWLDDDETTLQVHHEEVYPVDAEGELRVNTFDIEVDDRSGFPEDGEETIICLTSHDNYRDEYVVWLYEAPEFEGTVPDSLPDYDTLKDDTTIDVRSFETEAEMLNSFVEYIQKTDPDVLTGWNFEDFDAPYFLDRLDEVDPKTDYDLDPNRLSRIGEVWRSGWGGPDVKGRVVFDLLYGYKRTQFTELESYRLDAVGEVELGVGKERYSGDIGDLWENDPERLLEYNVRDVELCVELDRKQEIVAFWDEVRQFVGCLLEDAPTPGDTVDVYVLHKSHGRFALPTKGQAESEEYEGGAVFDPITGVKENVTVLDLKSLYPMCMVTINASPETKAPDDYDGEVYTAPNGTEFQQEPDGIIREMVDELLTEREEKKARRNEYDPDSEAYQQFDQQQQAVKVIMNSLYGVTGWDRFRLYDKEVGAAVTATGREVIRETETISNSIGHEVTYGDSVTGDRPVVVRDPTGAVRILEMESLFQRATSVDSGEILITTDGGPATAVSPDQKDRGELNGWEALSLSDGGEAEWQPIQQIIRHESDGQVVNLQHKFGESTTTTDHSYVVEDGDEFVECPPSSVDEPLRIPDVPEVETTETLDLYEELGGYNREYEDGRSVGSDDAETKVKRIHADDEYVWFGHKHHGSLDSSIKVQRHVDLCDEDGRALLRLLAAYITEGSASTKETAERKFGASISESRREWLEGLQADYYRLFENATAGITASDTKEIRTVEYDTASGQSATTYNDETQKLQMMNELSAVFFRELAGQTSGGKRIPWFVYHLPNPDQQLFIDTLVEGDGSRSFPRYSEEYADRNFDFETTSRELAAGLSVLLTQRGEKHSLKYRDEKDSYTIRTCDYYRSGRAPVRTEVDYDGYVYDLSVAENQNFVDAVGGIVLHNTDSVMLEIGQLSDDDLVPADEVPEKMREANPDATERELRERQTILETGFELEEQINDGYDEFAERELNALDHRFQIEFEKLYRRFFQAGKKKRYAGHIVWKEGKYVDDIDITGFEYKRSDIAPVTKRVQKDVLEMIVTGTDVEEIREYLKSEIDSFEDGAVDLNEIGIPGGIGKRLDAYETDTAQVRGAKYANAFLGTNFQRGSKPKRLYLDKVHPDFWRRMEDEQGLDPQRSSLYGEFKADPDVICFEYADQVPDEFEIDYEKMLEKTLKGPIARVIEALGMSWDEVKSGQEQTGLGSFM